MTHPKPDVTSSPPSHDDLVARVIAELERQNWTDKPLSESERNIVFMAVRAALAFSSPPSPEAVGNAIFGDLTTHSRNCPVGDRPNIDFDADCTCSLGYRRRWATAEEQSAAWRKRAMEAEAAPSSPVPSSVSGEMLEAALRAAATYREAANAGEVNPDEEQEMYEALKAALALAVPRPSSQPTPNPGLVGARNKAWRDNASVLKLGGRRPSPSGQYGELVKRLRHLQLRIDAGDLLIAVSALGHPTYENSTPEEAADALEAADARILALEAERSAHLQTIGDLQAERDDAKELAKARLARIDDYLLDRKAFRERAEKAEARCAELEKALERAVKIIRIFHGLGIPEEAEPSVWQAYQSSPEMKQINSVLAASPDQGNTRKGGE